jgi:GSH-dependent disulfide-bond oxidoreductase
MNALTQFPIAKKWPPRHPDRIQLYSLNTPNGVKASIMLEETGLPYEAHLVDFETQDQLSSEFASLNPYRKIPALIDPNGPEGPLPLFESGAILIYLADKTGRFLPNVSNARYETLKWLMFQVAGIGPMFGQVGFFHKFAGKEFEDKRPAIITPRKHESCWASWTRIWPSELGWRARNTPLRISRRSLSFAI